MMRERVKVVHASDLDLLDSAAELRRRIHHAGKLLAAVQLPSLALTDRACLLMRARGHLSGTLHKLEQLVAHVNREPAPAPIEDALTEPLRHHQDPPAIP